MKKPDIRMTNQIRDWNFRRKAAPASQRRNSLTLHRGGCNECNMMQQHATLEFNPPDAVHCGGCNDCNIMQQYATLELSRPTPPAVAEVG